MLYLEKPIVAVELYGDQPNDPKRELSGREHVDS